MSKIELLQRLNELLTSYKNHLAACEECRRDQNIGGNPAFHEGQIDILARVCIDLEPLIIEGATEIIPPESYVDYIGIS